MDKQCRSYSGVGLLTRSRIYSLRCTSPHNLFSPCENRVSPLSISCDLSRCFQSRSHLWIQGLTVYSALKKTNTTVGNWVVVPGAGGGLGHLGECPLLLVYVTNNVQPSYNAFSPHQPSSLLWQWVSAFLPLVSPLSCLTHDI